MSQNLQNDLDLAAEALKEIAEMHTGTRLDEAQCFLRARKLARLVCEELGIDHEDYTAGGQNRL
jgi:hypothetical protein